MNERIAKFAEQAGNIVVEDKWNGDYIDFNKEKFAELIVRECSEIATRLSALHANKDDAFYRGYTYAAERIARDIKGCFEVDKFEPLAPGELERLFGKSEE